MKFLFLAPRYHTNQIGIIRNLIKNKHKVFFNSLFKGKTEDHSLLKPFHLSQSNISKFLEFFFKTKYSKILFFPKIHQCFKIYKKINPDIAIIRFYGRLNIYLSALILKILGTKIIFYEQAPNDFSHLKKRKIRFFLKFLELKIQNIIFKSKWMTPIKKNNFFFKNTFFLPFIVDIKKNKRSKKNFKILIISKFQKRKSIYLALKSLLILSKEYKFNTTIIGEVSTREHKEYYLKCKNFINRNNLNKNVKLIMNLKHNKIYNYYSNHHLFLLPAANEPASISLLEAIGYSMPVICSDTCGTQFYVTKKFGKIFKTNQIKSLTSKIRFFLENKKKYEKFSINSFNYATNNLSEKNYNNYLEKHVTYKKK